jgi:hypothetical protein
LENREQREAEELADALKDAEMDTADFDAYVKSLQKLNPALAGADEFAKKLAKDNLTLSNAMNKVGKVLSDNKEALKDNNKGSAAYVTAISDIN